MMAFESDRLLLAAEMDWSSQPPQLGWRSALPLIAGAVLAILAIYADTARSIVSLWGSSDTFAHGYLIVPITLFLVLSLIHI